MNKIVLNFDLGFKWGDQSEENIRKITCFYKSLKKFDINGKVKEFLWKTSHKGLVLGDLRKRWSNANDDRCPICKQETETYKHLFIECNTIRLARIWLKNMSGEEIGPLLCTEEEYLFINGNIKEESRFFFNAIFKYAIWIFRNKITFDDLGSNIVNLKSVTKALIVKELQTKWERYKNTPIKEIAFRRLFVKNGISITDENCISIEG